MFALLKPRNSYEEDAARVYAKCLCAVREAVFYRDWGVPDNFDGRFDLLVAHVFLVVNRLKGEAGAFNQALFDAMFADMDQVLREMGVGDMGIPKRMKRMMLAFNGRMHAYTEAVAAGRLAEVLQKNVYSGAPGDAARLADYILHNIKLLEGVSGGKVIAGEFDFGLKEEK